MLDEVDPQRQALWIAEGDFFPLLDAFDGIFPYSIAWSPDPARQLQSYGQRVRDYNTQVKSFPTLLVAGTLGFHEREFFISQAEARKAPKVNLTTP